MPIFGLDVSHHQGGNLDFKAFRAAGMEYVILKATEGSTFVDSQFSANLARARAAGMMVAAYHYVRGNATAQAQLDNVKRVVPRDVPVILDIEANSGTLPPARTLVGLLQMAGYRVPMTYLPRWYWQQIGQPDLRGLPPLWSSRYPDNVIDTIANEWADVPQRYWDGYGNLPVVMLQFTSSAIVAGRSPLDANAFPGTRDQLAQLFGYSTPQPEEPDVKYILAKNANGPDHWLGDLLTRRKVRDMDELGLIQHWLGRTGNGDPTVVDGWADLDVLGTDVGGMVGALTNDEANILAAIRAIPEGTVDEEALAALLAPLVGPLIQAGASPAEVEAALRRVLADAGTPDEPPQGPPA